MMVRPAEIQSMMDDVAAETEAAATQPLESRPPEIQSIMDDVQTEEQGTAEQQLASEHDGFIEGTLQTEAPRNEYVSSVEMPEAGASSVAATAQLYEESHRKALNDVPRLLWTSAEVAAAGAATVAAMGNAPRAMSFFQDLETAARTKSEEFTASVAEKAAVAGAQVVGETYVGVFAGGLKAYLNAGAGITQVLNKHQLSDELEQLSGEIEVEQQERMREAFAQGDTSEAVIQLSGKVLGDVLGKLGLMKNALKLMGMSGLKTQGVGWKHMSKGTLLRAGQIGLLNYVQTKGTAAERARSAALGFAYMSTPVLSSIAPNDVSAVLFDFALNAAISSGYDPASNQFSGIFVRDKATGKWVPGGQYKAALDNARQMAVDSGNPDAVWQYALVNMLPIVGTDVGFSMLTRSAKARNDAASIALSTARPAVADMDAGTLKYYAALTKSVIRMGVPPQIAGRMNDMALNMVADGRVSAKALAGAAAQQWSVKAPVRQAPSTAVSVESGRTLGSKPLPGEIGRGADVTAGEIGKGPGVEAGEIRDAPERVAASFEEQVVDTGRRAGVVDMKSPIVQSEADKPRPAGVAEDRDAQYGLYEAVMEVGGVKTTDAFRDDLSDVTPRVKRMSGRPVDLLRQDLAERGFRFEDDKALIDALKKPRIFRGQKRLSENQHYAAMEMEDRAKYARFGEPLLDLESIRDTIFPRDFYQRSGDEQDVMRADWADAKQAWLAKRPELAVEKTITDDQGNTRKFRDFDPDMREMLNRSTENMLGELPLDTLPADAYASVKPVLGRRIYRPADVRKLHDVVADSATVFAELAPTDKTREALAASVDKGLDHLDHIQNLSRDNAERYIDLMAGSGPDGVKGVGPSTAILLKAIYRNDVTTEADVLKYVNDWRLGQGKETLPIPTGEPQETAYRVTEDEWAEIKTKMEPVLQKVDFAGSESATAGLEAVRRAQNFPLPNESGARSAQMKRLRAVFLSAYGDVKEPAVNREARQKASRDWFQGLASMRYTVLATAERTGNLQLVDDHSQLVNHNASAKYDWNGRFQRLFTESGVTEREIATRPDIADNLITILGTDVSNKAGKKAVAAAKAGLADGNTKWDEPGNRYKKLHDLVGGELNGATAVNVRRNQLHAWQRGWKRVGPKLLAAREAARQESLPGFDPKKAQMAHDKVVRLEAQLQKFAPWMKDADGKAHPVPNDVMLEGVKVLQQEGEAKLREWLTKQQWGTRQTYWMTEAAGTDGDFLASIQAKENPFFETGGKPSTTAATPSEIRPRFGSGPLRRNNFIGDLYKHGLQMEMRGRGLTNADSILAAIEGDKKMGQDTAANMRLMVDDLIGKGQEVGQLVQSLGTLNKIWWSLRAVSPEFVGWFNTRNILQDFALGPAQVGEKNFMLSATRVASSARDPNSRVRRAYDQTFARMVSQKEAMWHEFIRLEQATAPGGKRRSRPRVTPPSEGFLNVKATVEGIGRGALTWSDTMNRAAMWTISYDVADRHLSAILNNQTTHGAAETAMKLDNMPVMQSIQLSRMLDQAVRTGNRDSLESESFLQRYAEIKNENTNFIYRSAGRSGLEQRASARPWVNLFTWPRGAFEVVKRNGIDPIMDGFAVMDSAKLKTALKAGDVAGVKAAITTADINKVRQGAETLGLYVAHMYMAGLAHALIYGQRRYGDTISPAYHPLWSMAWNLGSPAATLVGEALEKLSQLRAADAQQIQNIGEWFGNEGVMLIPVLGQMRRVYDAHDDTRGSRNIDIVLEQLGWGENMTEDAQRNWFGKAWFSLFGVEHIFGSEAATLKQALTLGGGGEE